MAKGYQANKEHMAAIQMLGKGLAKRAGFRCEWCGNSDDLRPWDYRPEQEPELARIAAERRCHPRGGACRACACADR